MPAQIDLAVTRSIEHGENNEKAVCKVLLCLLYKFRFEFVRKIFYNENDNTDLRLG